MSIGLDFWLFVQTGCIHLKYPPTDLEGIKKFGYNDKVINAILDGLGRIDFVKVMHCKNNKGDMGQIANHLCRRHQGKKGQTP